MAKTKISALTTLADGSIAIGDLIPIVDIDDFSQAASGTTKKVTITSLASAVATAFSSDAATFTNLTATGTLGVTGNATFDTNVLFVDAANDRVGIGTTAPAYKLDLVGSGGTISRISDTSTYAGLIIDSYSTSGSTPFLRFSKGTTGKFEIGYAEGTDMFYLNPTSGSNDSGAALKINKTTGAATFSGTLGVTGATTLTGNVGIGLTPSSGAPLEVAASTNYVAKFVSSNSLTLSQEPAQGNIIGTNVFYGSNWTAISSTAGQFIYMGIAGGANPNVILFGNSTSGGSPTSMASINTSTGAYTNLSDVNSKKDFEDNTIGLNAILKLKTKLFRFKTETQTNLKHLGFIAQEVQEHIPQAYTESEGLGDNKIKFIGLQDRPIIAVIVKAIQELSAKVTALESK